MPDDQHSKVVSHFSVINNYNSYGSNKTYSGCQLPDTEGGFTRPLETAFKQQVSSEFPSKLTECKLI